MDRLSREDSKHTAAVQPFRDRVQASRAMAAELAHYAHRSDVVVVALPRGGVPIGFEIARALGAQLDVILVRKLGMPGHEELAAGAIAGGGVRVVNFEPQAPVDREKLERLARKEQLELERREQLYRGDRPSISLENRVVILVDDGIATGATMRAAIAAVRQQHPAKVVVAVPVAPASALDRLRADADELVCISTPEPFRAISVWYADFRQVDDASVRELLDRSRRPDWRSSLRADSGSGHDVKVPVAGMELEGTLSLPQNAAGIIIFCNAGGSCPKALRDRHLAAALNDAGLGSLLLPLLTPEEEAIDAETQELGFDVDLLSARLLEVMSWVVSLETPAAASIGLFGVGTGGAAVLRAAARRPDVVRATVLRAGRTDLAGSSALSRVLAPTLMVVGSRDPMVLALNREAIALLACPHRLEIVPGATHSFDEPGMLDEATRLSVEWLRHYL